MNKKAIKIVSLVLVIAMIFSFAAMVVSYFL